MLKFYDELAEWWHLISPPEDYVEEVEFFLPLLAEVTAHQPVTMLELGSGGGNNAFYMKSAFSSVTLVDIAPNMLAASAQINPECEHIEGDMRTVRLGRTFDVVFIHDAIDYMTTLDDLGRAIETAFAHCKPGGMALFVPDHVRETFEPDTEHDGHDEEGRSVRYLEWSYDPDERDTSYITDYVFMIREDNQPVRVVHDQHVLGLFFQEDWLRIMKKVGFTADFVIDSFERFIFVAHKPG